MIRPANKIAQPRDDIVSRSSYSSISGRVPLTILLRLTFGLFLLILLMSVAQSGAEYFGYLRRNANEGPDPDYSGYDFWLKKLNQFNGDYQKSEMVKAFITSAEYRQRFGPS